MLSDQVELSVKGIHKGSEKQEVIKELRAWAKNAQLSSVRSIHEGVAENKSSHFKIATAKSRKETFRIFVYVQEDEGKQKIKKIKIDK